MAGVRDGGGGGGTGGLGYDASDEGEGSRLGSGTAQSSLLMMGIGVCSQTTPDYDGAINAPRPDLENVLLP